MKHIFLLSALWLSITCSFSSGIEGITLENYPRMDGSTSSEPLNRVIAKNLLKINFDSIVYNASWEYQYPIEMTFHINDGNGNIFNISYPQTVMDRGCCFTIEYTYYYRTYQYSEYEGTICWDNYSYDTNWKNELECERILCNGCFIESIDSVFRYFGEGKKYNPQNFIGTRVKSSQTHNSIINVIDNAADITLSARTMSADEKKYAESKGVTLIETPIALDAFVFLKNETNPITSLTIEQVQGIYTGQITNWHDVGGNDAKIIPYVRNQNSGSQELMEQLVLSGFPIPKYPEDITLFGMGWVYSQLAGSHNGICYTVYYYDENKLWAPEEKYYFNAFKYTDGRKDEIVEGILNGDGTITVPNESYEYKTVERLAVNGIYPNYNTIKDKSYPLVAPVYAIIRSDLDKNSMAHKVYEWLQTEEGKEVIEQSGYIAYTPVTSGNNQIIASNNIQIFPNPTSGIVYTSTTGKIKVYNLQGVLLQETFGSQIDLSTYPQGLYLFQVNDAWGKVVKK